MTFRGIDMNKLDTIIIHPDTRRLLDDYLSAPAQSLLLVATPGLYVNQIAHALADQSSTNTTTVKPTIHDKQIRESINADDIADVANIVRNKNPGGLTVVIESVNLANHGIFERLLKLVEEPSTGVHYIFTTPSLASIPQTIVSRCAVINIKAAPQAEVDSILKSLPPDKRAQASFIARGKPELAQNIATNPQLLDALAKTMQTAKVFISSGSVQRLQIVSQITSRADSLEWLEGLRLLISSAPVMSAMSQAEWSRRANLVAETIEAIINNGLIKLQLINLAINF